MNFFLPDIILFIVMKRKDTNFDPDESNFTVLMVEIFGLLISGFILFHRQVKMR